MRSMRNERRKMKVMKKEVKGKRSLHAWMR